MIHLIRTAAGAIVVLAAWWIFSSGARNEGAVQPDSGVVSTQERARGTVVDASAPVPSPAAGLMAEPSPQEVRQGWRTDGAAAFSPQEPDFGYSRVPSEEEVGKQEQHERVAGWYWTFIEKKTPDAVAFFKGHPEFHREEFIAALADASLATDRALLKQWMTDNQTVPGLVRTGVGKWLEAHSLEASQWIATLPDGPLKKSARDEMVRWLKENADVEGGDEWESMETKPR